MAGQQRTPEVLIMDWIGALATASIGPAAITFAVVSVTSNNGSGVVLPASGSYRMRFTDPVNNPGVEEWMNVDMPRAGTTINLSGVGKRGENSTAQTWVAGAIIEAVPTEAGMRRAFVSGPGRSSSKDRDVFWDGTTATVVDNRKSYLVDQTLWEGDTDFLHALWFQMAVDAKTGPAGSQSLRTSGASYQLRNGATDNSVIPVVGDYWIGKPFHQSTTGSVTNGSKTFTDSSNPFIVPAGGVLLDSASRMVYLTGLLSGNPFTEVNTIGTVTNTGSVQLVTNCSLDTGPVTWTSPITFGMRVFGQGPSTRNQGNFHPDDGGLLLQATAGGTGWTNKGMVDWRNSATWTIPGNGSENFEVRELAVDCNSLADYGFVGIGVGTGNCSKGVDLIAQGATVSNYGLTGNRSDHGSSSDMFWDRLVSGKPMTKLSKTWQNGTQSLPQGTITLNNITSIPPGEGYVEVQALTVAAAPTVAQGTAGSPPTAGDHFYAYSYVTAAGETPISPASVGIPVSANKITVTVVNGPTGVTSKKIYRTKANTPTIASGFPPKQAELLLVGTIGDNLTTTFSDTFADGTLGAAGVLTGQGTQLIHYTTSSGSNLQTCIGGQGIMVNGQTVNYYAYGADVNGGDAYGLGDFNFATNEHALLLNLTGSVGNFYPRGTAHMGGGSGGTSVVVAACRRGEIPRGWYDDNAKGDRGAVWVVPISQVNGGTVSQLTIDCSQYNIQDASLAVPIVFDGANISGPGNSGSGYEIGGRTNGNGGASGNCPAFVKYVNGWPQGAGIMMRDVSGQSILAPWITDYSQAPVTPDTFEAATISLITGLNANTTRLILPSKSWAGDTTLIDPVLWGNGAWIYNNVLNRWMIADGTIWRALPSFAVVASSVGGTGQTLVPDLALGDTFERTVTGTTAGSTLAINAPTHVAAGEELTIIVFNNTTGAGTVVTTLNATNFKMNIGAWTDPAQTKRRMTRFKVRSDLVTWDQIMPVSSDY